MYPGCGKIKHVTHKNKKDVYTFTHFTIHNVNVYTFLFCLGPYAKEQTLNTELSIVKLMLAKDHFKRYGNAILKVKTQFEITKLLDAVLSYYREYDHHEYIAVDELETYFHSAFPSEKNNETFTRLFDRLRTLEVSDSLATSVVKQYIEQYHATKIVEHLLPSVEGISSGRLLELPEMVDNFKSELDIVETTEDIFADIDIEEVFKQKAEFGLRWRLNCLNEKLGPIAGGDLGHVFARVDTGKTSFIVSEMSHWASQIADDESILWIANEEAESRLVVRLYECVLDLSAAGLSAALAEKGKEAVKAEFLRRGGGRVKLCRKHGSSMEQIRELLERMNVRALVVDIGDKVHFRGEADLNGPTRLGVLYEKYRDFGSHYDIPILTAGQASSEATGRKVLLVDHMHNSKTDKPGALDYAIGIGKTLKEEEANLRWVTCCKNKLRTTNELQADCVRVNFETGRFYDIK